MRVRDGRWLVACAAVASMLAASAGAGAAVVPAPVRLPELPAGLNVGVDAAVSCVAVGTCTVVGSGSRLSAGRFVGVPLITVQRAGRRSRPVVFNRLPAEASRSPLDAEFEGVSCVGGGECVAVGYFSTAHAAEPMVAAEQHGVWGPAQALRLPRGLVRTRSDRQMFATLDSVSCPEMGSCVAVGGDTHLAPSGVDERAIYVTETRGRWGVAQLSRFVNNARATDSSELRSVSCPSAGNCTAVGRSGGVLTHPPQPLTLREVAGHWQPMRTVTIPRALRSGNRGILESVSCASAGNCSAVGAAGSVAQPLAVTETAGRWAPAVVLAGATVLPATMISVSCVAPGDCAALGDPFQTAHKRSFGAEQSGGAWGPITSVAGSTGDWLESISCPALDGCVAVGYGGSPVVPVIAAP